MLFIPIILIIILLLIAVETKKRCAKTLQGQIEIFVNEMASCEQLRTGTGDPAHYNLKWEALAAELNSFGKGPKKTAKDWDQTFKNWKCSVRHKARLIATYDKGQSIYFIESHNAIIIFSFTLHFTGTGGGPAITKRLTDLEERAISIWGKEAIVGVAMGSHGLIEENNTQQVVEPEPEILDIPVVLEVPMVDTQDRKKRYRPKTTTMRCDSRRVDVLASLQKNDSMIASAICRLADSVTLLAESQSASVNALVETNKMLLTEIIRANRNDDEEVQNRDTSDFF